MFNKLDALLDRCRELDEALSQPEIIQDYEKYQVLLKERSGLQPLFEKYHEYLSVSRQIREARELLSDPDFSAEAEKEISELLSRKQALADELKLLLVPPDPLDNRNTIMEIRAGVGGAHLARPAEEITLLDLFRAVEKDEALFHFHENPNPLCPVGRNIHTVMDSRLTDIQSAMERQMAETTLRQLVDETQEKA
jgi:peptide chain release factor 1